MANETKAKKRKTKRVTGRKVLHKTPVAPQQLRLTMVGRYRVSTVNLNMAPSFVALCDAFLNPLLGRSPASFETMVFDGDDSHDLDMARYATEAAAVAGHKKMVAKWRTYRVSR